MANPVDPNAPSVLTVSGIGKTYAEPVLADVTLDLRAGEVLALTGENGAGKSTLSKIVGGLVTPTTGTMTLAGAPYAPASRSDAEALGVRMVMQELNLLPTLSVAENLFLNRLPQKGGRFGWIDRRTLRENARHAMAQVGLDAIDPDTPVGALGHRASADGRDRAQPDRRLPRADPRRTDRDADRARSRPAVRADRAAEGARRGARLYLAPAGGTEAHRGARGGAARRPAGACRRDGRTDERPARHADGRARHRRADRSRRAPHRRRRAEGGTA